MPFVLPGLFDFSAGVSSSIAQTGARLRNDNQETQNYLATLNAFNASLNTNDNLQFRQGFANQDQATPVLERLQNIGTQTANPFVAGTALTQSAALSPLLGQAALGNPSLALQQSIPQAIDQQITQGILGLQPAVTQQYNNTLLPQILQPNNPGLQAGQLATIQANTQLLGADNQQAQAAQQQITQLQETIAQLNRQLASQSAARSSQNTMTSAVSAPLQTSIIPVDPAGNLGQRQGQPQPVIGGTSGANSRTGN